ncbi:polysaccharide biosynthesis protein [Idiomarina tyrosinivorans]|uniref:Polysaccharide biosynthesis protein n=1 Tax=Idiomarina tyrosinivorans TaxID=1445662 RepID=A0A432ZQS5_9GAMM|nr:lipopolysaccharide biosynthesis protein [Idiomarina tyrosinivorans]RUO80264.1 polysaccharide biosynthesis protein [Idiomarina tyrosinivorans]
MTPRNILSFAIGPVGGALLGLITLPLVTWFFSQEDVGRLSMLQVTLSFGVLLFSLGLDQAYVREFHEREDKPALLKQAALPGFLLLTFFIAVFLCFGELFSDLLFEVPAVHLSLLVALGLLASFTSRFLSLVLRMNERGFAYSMSQLLPKLLLVILVSLYVLLGADKTLTNLVAATIVSLVAVTLVFAWNTREEWVKAVSAPFDLNEVKSMLRFGLPLILGGLAFWGLTALDKVFLRALSSYEELAVYSVSVSFAAVATIFQTVFSTLWAPTVYKWASFGEGIENISKVQRYVTFVVVTVFCLAGLLSWLIPTVLPESYDDVQWIMVSCLGFPLLYTLSETTVVGIGVSRKSLFSMIASISAFIINILGNLLLIPNFGAKGAAVSTCLSFFIFFVLRTEFSNYLWIKFSRGLMYKFSFLSVSTAVSYTLFGEGNIGVFSLLWFFILFYALLEFRLELKDASLFVFNRLRKFLPKFSQ